MSFFSGREPASRGRRRFVSGTLLFQTVIVFTFVSPAMAERTLPLTLAEAERLALVAEPGREALLAGGEAMRKRATSAGELPEPMIRFGLNNFPIESGGFTTEGMTNVGVGLRQELPSGNSLEHASERYRELSAAIEASAEARERDVREAVRHAWLDAYYLDRAYTLVENSRSYFEELVAVTVSLYRVGKKSQQDVLRAELELSRLDDRLIDIESRRATAKAALGEWIGEEARRPVADKLPDWPEPDSAAALAGSLSGHPRLAAADARVEAQEAAVRGADEQSKPRWAVELGYAYRDGRLGDGSSRSDFMSLNVTVGLPFFSKKSIDSDLQAALADKSAAEAERTVLERRLNSQLESEYARWRELGRRLALYDSRVIGQTDAYAEATLTAYRNNRADFAEVMSAYIKALDTRIEHVGLRVERAKRYATLANLGGQSL